MAGHAFDGVAHSVEMRGRAALGGHGGLSGIPAISVFGLPIDDGRRFCYLVWGFVLLVALLVQNLLNSRQGRAIRCLKGGRVMAEAMGVNIRVTSGPIIDKPADLAGLLTSLARRNGVSGYPGDGTQRWPAVHALDAAVLFRLALENAPAGSSWHAVDDEGDAVRDIAAVIGRRLGLPIESLPQKTYGPLGPIFATDQPSSSANTREILGWKPTHPNLLDDLENIQP